MANQTSKPIAVTCLECGRPAQVIDASRWACPHCTLIQPTAPRIVAECWTCRETLRLEAPLTVQGIREHALAGHDVREVKA